MTFIVEASFPLEPFNTDVRKGMAGERIGEVFASIRPEVGYCTDNRPRRGALLIAISPGDLQAAGLDRYASA